MCPLITCLCVLTEQPPVVPTHFMPVCVLTEQPVVYTHLMPVCVDRRTVAYSGADAGRCCSAEKTNDAQ